MCDKNANRDTLLEVKDLQVEFRMRQGTLHAARGVNFSLKKGEILGLVGESPAAGSR